MEPPDPIRITLQVTGALEALDIPYLVGGSLASIIHGVLRTTVDSDLVAAIQPRHVRPLTQQLSREFWIEPDSIFSAIQHKGSFALIHKESNFKVDVFVDRGRPFDRERFRRREAELLLESPEESAWVSSAEDIVLAKLEWFKKGGEVSERQWRDILGVIKMQGDALDVTHLRRWARVLGVDTLLERALEEGQKEE